MYSSSRPELVWTRVAFRCTRIATVGDITLFFPCSSVIYSSWNHIGNETRSSGTSFIRLVREHAASFRPHPSDRSRRPLFSSDALRCASDWFFDLDDALIFPTEIAATLQRPDIVIFLRGLRQVILIELTVPLEDRVCLTPMKEKKNAFCHDCLFARVTDGMQLIFLSKSGVRNEASKVSLRCSYLIYLRRNSRVWQGSSGD